MIDIFGIVIEEGDRIAFNPPKYKGLTLGIVIGFTPQRVKVRYRGVYNSKDITNVAPLDIAVDMNKRLANKEEALDDK